MEYETLTGDEIKGLMEGRPVVRVDPDDTKGQTGSAVPTAGRPTKPREEPDSGGMAPAPTA